jgi:hypothetical protein
MTHYRAGDVIRRDRTPIDSPALARLFSEYVAGAVSAGVAGAEYWTLDVRHSGAVWITAVMPAEARSRRRRPATSTHKLAGSVSDAERVLEARSALLGRLTALTRIAFNGVNAGTLPATRKEIS